MADKPKKKEDKKADKKPAPQAPGVPPRLRDLYHKEVVPQMRERFGYKNAMQVPRIEKVVLNVGVGVAVQEPKQLDNAISDISLITGQRPVVTRAKKSISNFKIREGMRIGLKVTLRRERMYYFLDKLFNVVMPRLRDFQGVSPDSLDGRGNFAMGVREQIVFPEIDYDKVDKTRGMDIIIVTSARTDEEARHLLRLMGLPFAERRTPQEVAAASA
jgi:large subunit ribosomal protein L5